RAHVEVPTRRHKMLVHHNQLNHLERTALAQLLDVDLMTPMQQIRLGLEALIDVPTTVRGANSAFSGQAAAVLEVLSSDVERLREAIKVLTEHVHRTSSLSRSRHEAHYLLATVTDN
ncbi:hypothetical protein, partial [Candidatus Entotheonella palauensis]